MRRTSYLFRDGDHVGNCGAAFIHRNGSQSIGIFPGDAISRPPKAELEVLGDVLGCPLGNRGVCWGSCFLTSLVTRKGQNPEALPPILEILLLDDDTLPLELGKGLS